MTKQKMVFAPCSEKQKLILQESDVNCLLIGGGAGSGKTRMCLTKFLSEIKNPHAKIVIFRRTIPELNGSF